MLTKFSRHGEHMMVDMVEDDGEVLGVAISLGTETLKVWRDLLTGLRVGRDLEEALHDRYHQEQVERLRDRFLQLFAESRDGGNAEPAELFAGFAKSRARGLIEEAQRASSQSSE
jgi:hypothetical protein